MTTATSVLSIHPSLWLLLKMNSRGALRKFIRNLLTFHGLVVTAIIAGYIYFAITHQNELVADFYAVLSHYGGLALFLLFLLSLGTGLAGRGVYFSKPEAQLILTAPVDRGELLIYLFLRHLRGAVLTTGILSLLISAESFVQVFCRLLPATLAMAAFPLAVMTLCQKLPRRTVQTFRHLHYSIMSALVVASIAGGASVALGTRKEAVLSIVDSLQAHPVLVSFHWANSLLYRPGLEATLLWAGITGAFAIICFGITLRYFDLQDDGFHENQEQITEKVEKLKRQGLALRGVRTFEFNVPDLPSLGGIGPVLWRRCQELSRHVPYLIGLLLIGLTYHAFLASMIAKKIAATGKATFGVGDLNSMGQMVAMMIGFLVAAYDFKADTHRLEWLKSLPIKSSRVVVGQTMMSSIYLAFFMSLIVVFNYAILSHYFPQKPMGPDFFGYLLWSLPLGALYTLSANALFLLIPTYGAERRSAIGMFQYFVGFALLWCLMMLIFFIVGGCASLSKYFGDSDALFFATSTGAFTVLAGFAFLIVIWAYDRFDVSRISR